MTRFFESPDSLDHHVLRVQKGDKAAFEFVVQSFERPLRAWLAGNAQPGIDVDEIAQRAFIAAYTSIGDYQVGTSFSAWLYSIAKFQLRTETTRLRRLADYHSRYAPDLLHRALEESESESTEVWEDKLESLRECMKMLGADLSKYLSWRYRDQITIEEMAIRSGRSSGAIKKQLWLLRQKLLRCIQERMASME